MNIFVLDTDIKLSARYHCDRHVVKMVLESTQILCNVYHTNSDIVPPYRLVNRNHPCCIWARETRGNYIWLIEFATELSNEYTYRYGKIHGSTSVIKWCNDNLQKLNISGNYLTPFALAMPIEYQSYDVVESYRDYYRNEKSNLLTYTKHPRPDWL